MDVDIDRCRVDFEIDEVVGLLVGANELFVAMEDSFVEIRMAHVASVDEEVLQRASLTGVFGEPYEACDFSERSFGLDRD